MSDTQTSGKIRGNFTRRVLSSPSLAHRLPSIGAVWAFPTRNNGGIPERRLQLPQWPWRLWIRTAATQPKPSEVTGGRKRGGARLSIMNENWSFMYAMFFLCVVDLWDELIIVCWSCRKYGFESGICGRFIGLYDRKQTLVWSWPHHAWGQAWELGHRANVNFLQPCEIHWLTNAQDKFPSSGFSHIIC